MDWSQACDAFDAYLRVERGYSPRTMRSYGRDLSEDERLVFAADERPPTYDPDAQPAPPAAEWSEERLAKANRNYAVEYIRNGLDALCHVIGRERTLELSKRAARLIGLQHYPIMAAAVGAVEGGPLEAVNFLSEMMAGMGDECMCETVSDDEARLTQSGLRIARGLDGDARDILLESWVELWCGAIHSHRRFMDVQCNIQPDQIRWTVRNA